MVVGVIGGAISAVAGLIGLVFLLFPGAEPKDDPPGVELVDFDVAREQDIRADWTADGKKGKEDDYAASLVTVVLRNPGDNPAYINEAVLRFSGVRQVGCQPGAGLTEITAGYDIKLPLDARAGFTARQEMAYKLPPHGLERIAFTVGPKQTFEASPPWIYEFSITVRMSDGSQVTTPQVAYLSPVETSDDYLDTAEAALNGEYAVPYMTPQCLAGEARKVARIAEEADHSSVELKRFSRRLAEITAG